MLFIIITIVLNVIDDWPLINHKPYCGGGGCSVCRRIQQNSWNPFIRPYLDIMWCHQPSISIITSLCATQQITRNITIHNVESRRLSASRWMSATPFNPFIYITFHIRIEYIRFQQQHRRGINNIRLQKKIQYNTTGNVAGLSDGIERHEWEKRLTTLLLYKADDIWVLALVSNLTSFGILLIQISENKFNWILLKMYKLVSVGSSHSI